MPVSRPTPPYLQSPWHPPTTTQTALTELLPHTTVSSQPGTVSQYYTEQRVVLVPTAQTRKVRRAIAVWKEVEVVEDDDSDEQDQTRTGAERGTTEKQEETRQQHYQQQQQHRAARRLMDAAAGGSGINGGGAEEKESDDVVLDIHDPTAALSTASSSSSLSFSPSLSSLVQPLSLSSVPSSSSPSSPSAASLLSRYNPRIINGYLDRRRPHSRKLLAVPNEALPPPPFMPPSYPLSSSRHAATHTDSSHEQKEKDSTEGRPAGHKELTIDLFELAASFPLAGSVSGSDWSDPTSLDSAGLILRDTVLLPRGSPRFMYAGCAVYEVREGSRAWLSGVRSGDSIVSVEGREVRSEEECVRLVNRVCGTVQLAVRRDGELIQLTM